MRNSKVVGWVYLRRKAMRQRVWKVVNIVVAVTTIVNVSALGAFIAPRAALASSGSIWTTTSSCGTDPQDANHYNVGDHVYINGSGFDADTSYAWDIDTVPPTTPVASGNELTDGNGDVCFFAYEIQPGDKGEYKATFDGKHDNYRVNTGSVVIHKGLDANGDGIFEGNDDAGNAALFRWGFNAEPQTQLFGANVTDVVVGSYDVNENSQPGYHPAGWISGEHDPALCNDPQNYSQGSPQIIVADKGSSEILLCNAADEAPTSSITVNKWLWNGEAWAQNNAQASTLGFHWVLDSASPALAMGATANDVAFGNHTVAETAVLHYHTVGYFISGTYKNDEPTSCANLIGTSEHFTLNVESTDGYVVNFCNAADPIPSTISGTKYYDWNHNDQTDPGDQPLADWTIKLYNANWGLLGTTVTDANGDYSFGNLSAGNYFVCEVVKDGWTWSQNPAGQPWAQNEYCRYVSQLGNSESRGDVDFHNYLIGAIHGQKWNDLNGNGIRDCVFTDNISLEIPIGPTCEPLLNGWTIFIDGNGNGQLDNGEQSMQTQTHDLQDGWYWFSDLQPGAYSVCEVAQGGWQQTYPTNGNHNCHTVTVPQPNEGDTCFNLQETNSVTSGSMCNFGNKEIPIVTISKTDNHTTANPGETLTYQVTVNNTGGATAFGIHIDDVLPNFISSVTNISDSGVMNSGHIAWDLSSLAAHTSKTLTYDVTVNASMPIGTSVLHNQADLGCSPVVILDSLVQGLAVLPQVCQFSGQATDDTSVTVTPVPVPQVLGAQSPNLSIAKSVSATTTNPGKTLTYTLTVKSTGDGQADNVIVTDTLPAGFTYVDGGGSTKTWNLGTMAAGSQQVITYQVHVGSNVKAGNYTNTAVVKANDVGPLTATAAVRVLVPQVLGLATTGVGGRDYAIFMAGLILLASGFVFLKRYRREPA